MLKQRTQGNSIKILCLLLGVNFEELAELCEVSHSTINAWSIKIFRINKKALIKLCNKTGINIDELVKFLNDGGYEVYE